MHYNEISQNGVWPRNVATVVGRSICYENVRLDCPSVRLSVTLVSHALTVQDIKIYIAPHHRTMFLVSWDQISQSRLQGLTPNDCIKERHPGRQQKFDQCSAISGKRCDRPCTDRLTGSRILAFDWYQKWWPRMTLNHVMAVILRHFTQIKR